VIDEPVDEAQLNGAFDIGLRHRGYLLARNFGSAERIEAAKTEEEALAGGLIGAGAANEEKDGVGDSIGVLPLFQFAALDFGDEIFEDGLGDAIEFRGHEDVGDLGAAAEAAAGRDFGSEGGFEDGQGVAEAALPGGFESGIEDVRTGGYVGLNVRRALA
jgi:hypothetical protein